MAELTKVQQQRRQFQIYSWTGASVVAAIILGLNFIVNYFPLRLDTSDGRAYSLSRGSKDLLKKLDDTLVVKVLFSSDLPPVYKLNEKYVVDLLSEYKRASHGHIRVEYVDPGKTPQTKSEAVQLGVMPVQLDVRERDRREVKECFMGVAFLFGDKKEAIGLVQDTSNLEYEISSRIKKLVDPHQTQFGFISAGGAMGLESPGLSEIVGQLKQLYAIQDVDLSKPVGPEVKALWWVGPSSEPDPKAIENLREYLKLGGVVGLLLNSQAVSVQDFRATPVKNGLEAFLSEWGLKLSNGFVVDQQCDRIQVQAMRGQFRMINVIDYPYFPWVAGLDRKHPATKNLDGVTMPFVSPIDIAERKPGVTYTPLAVTSPYSFLDPHPFNLNPLMPHEPAADSPKGPFNVGVLVENKDSRLIVFGTSRWVDASYPLRPNNYGLLSNLIDWSVQDEALIQIRSKGLARRPIRDLGDGVRGVFKYLMLLALPLGSVAIGLVLWRRQKVRRALLPLRYQQA